MSAAYAQMPGAPARNSLPVRFYTYRGTGTDTLTPELDDLPDEPVKAYPGGYLELKPCGTEAAYKRHQRRGEPVDEACRAANRRKVARTRERDAA